MRRFAERTRQFFLSLLVFLVFALPAFAGEIARVVNVVDGDTVILQDGRKVRYLGINTPERGESLYRQAGDFNRSLVMGKTVRLELKGDRDNDAYGRLLAYVYVGDRMVNARLIQEGMAHAFFIGPKSRYNAVFLTYQAEARQRGVGIWAGSGRSKQLKITTVHPASPTSVGSQGSSYVRVASLADKTLQLGGYVLSDGKGSRFLFPDVRVDPGYTVIISGRAEANGANGRKQSVVYWPNEDSVWKPEGGIALLADRSSTVVDTFPYEGVRRSTTFRNSPGEVQGKIIGNRSSKIYHLPGQASYHRIKEKNRVYFDTEEEAVRTGYRRAKR